MTYTQTCPRCGDISSGDDPDAVAAQAVAHARVEHGHTVTQAHIRSHLHEVNPATEQGEGHL